MAVAIGIASCSSGSCYAPDEVMGSILYNGRFHPVYHESSQPPYQNFTVTIPSHLASGKAHINVVHATLIGVSPLRGYVMLVYVNLGSGRAVPLHGGLEPDCCRGLTNLSNDIADDDPFFVCGSCLYPPFDYTCLR